MQKLRQEIDIFDYEEAKFQMSNRDKKLFIDCFWENKAISNRFQSYKSAIREDIYRNHFRKHIKDKQKQSFWKRIINGLLYE